MLQIFLCLAVALAYLKPTDARVAVKVYLTYEGDGSKNVFINQIVPTRSKFLEVGFEILTFSNAVMNGPNLVCIYGEEDCKGNGMITCTLSHVKTELDAFEMIKCLYEVGVAAVETIEQCGNITGLVITSKSELEALKYCYANEAYHWDISLAVQYGLRKVKEVPYLAFNNRYDNRLSNDGLTALPKAICEVEMIAKCDEYLKNPDQFMPKAPGSPNAPGQSIGTNGTGNGATNPNDDDSSLSKGRNEHYTPFLLFLLFIATISYTMI